MASKLMTAKDYIASAANARAVYSVLFESAMGALPPGIAGEHNVECYFTARDLAAKIEGRSVSIIQNELRWLTSWGWISTSNRNLRFLGRRINGTLYLLADLAARDATGEDRLVSREILGLQYSGPPQEITSEHVARGTMRQWRGTETRGGGSLELDS